MQEGLSNYSEEAPASVPNIKVHRLFCTKKTTLKDRRQIWILWHIWCFAGVMSASGRHHHWTPNPSVVQVIESSFWIIQYFLSSIVHFLKNSNIVWVRNCPFITMLNCLFGHCLFVFLSRHHSDQISEGSQVWKVTLKCQSSWLCFSSTHCWLPTHWVVLRDGANPEEKVDDLLPRFGNWMAIFSRC